MLRPLTSLLSGPVRRKSQSKAPSGPALMDSLERREMLSADMVIQWNKIMLDAIRTVKPPPPMAARNMAITSLAVYDSVNSIEGKYTSYLTKVNASPATSEDAAVAEAVRAGEGTPDIGGTHTTRGMGEPEMRAIAHGIARFEACRARPFHEPREPRRRHAREGQLRAQARHVRQCLDDGVACPRQRSGISAPRVGSKRKPSRASVNPHAARYVDATCRQPWNMIVPGMHGSLWKCPSKNQ